MEQVAGHDLGLDPVAQGLEHLHRAPAPVDQRAIGDVGAHPREDLVQAIEGDVIVELGDEDVGQQAGTGHAARDRTAGGRLLDHLLAAAAGLLRPGDLDDLQLRRDQIKHLAHILADEAQVAAAIRAAGAGVELAALARGRVRHARTAAGRAVGRIIRGRRWRLIGGAFIDGARGSLGGGDQQILQRQLELFDLALDLLGGLAEGLLLQLRDAQPQRLDQLVMGADGRRHLRVLRLQGGDHRPQQGRIFGKACGVTRHAAEYHGAAGSTIKTRRFRRINHPTRAGGTPQSGRRQSIPSHSIASCADVSRTAPEVVVGHGKRPRSSTL